MAGISFDVTGDNANFLQRLRECEAGVRNTSRQIEESGMSIEQMFERIKNAASYTFVGFSAKEFVSSVAQVRGEFQQLEVAFNTMLGSKEKADDLMQQLIHTAAITPSDLQGVANGAKQLLAYGDSLENVNDDLIRLGNIAAGLSQPLGDIVYLYGTTMTQGRLYTQDLNQFTGRGIPMIRELANLFGVAENEVKDLVTAGKVGFPEVQKVIQNLTNEGGMFYNLMQEQSKTITGQISNIEDAFDTMLNNIGKANEGIINKALFGVSYLVENYEAVGREIMAAVAAYGAYKAVLMSVTALQSLQAAGIASLTTREIIHYGWLVMTKKAQDALNLSMLKNPYVIVAVSAAALVYGIYKLATAETTAEKAVRKHREEHEKFQKSLDERRGKIDSLLRTIQDETETEYAQIKAYEELKVLSPALAEAYKREELATASLTETTKKLNEERDKINYQKLVDNASKWKAAYEIANKATARTNEEIDAIYKIIGKEKGSYIDKQYINEQLRLSNEALNEYNRLKKKAEEEAKPVEVKLMEAQNDRDQIVQEFAAAKMVLEQEQEKLKDSPFSVIPIDVQIRFNNAQEQLRNIDNRIESLQSQQVSSSVTYKEAYEQAKANWKAQIKALQDAQKGTKDEYTKAKKELEDAEKAYKDLGGDTTGKTNKEADKQLEQQQKLADQLLSLRRQNQQDEINLMEEGTEEKLKQIELDYQKELDAIKKQEEEWKKAQGGKLTQEQTDELGKRASNAAQTREKRISDTTKAQIEAERQAMNEYLKEYGDYMEKRQAIAEQYNEKIAKATTEGERLSLGEKMKEELAAVDDEAQKKTSIITKLFDDMSKKTVEDMRAIADEAEKMLSYLNSGEFKTDESGAGLFGLTKEQFEILSKSPEKLESIKNEIANVRNEADAAEPALKKVADGLKDIFSSGGDSKKLKDALASIRSGLNEVMQAAGFLSDSLSSLGDSLGIGALSGIAEGISTAMGVVDSTMKGAEVGSMFGPIGSAAGAALGAVSSLASAIAGIHDRKNEKRIQKLQDQIDVLDKSYEKLGNSIEKAYSKDASGLIEDQNKLLEQQKVLIQQQIREEQDKKKTDNDRIKEWQEQIEDINKVIEENKEKAIDAIFGEDLKSAIDNFADAYAEAWANGEDRATSAKDTVKKMMQQMVTESIKAAIQSSGAMEEIRQKLQEFYADNVLSGWEQDYIYTMAEQLQRELDQQFGWADSLMGGSSTTSQTATGKGFETMSQDTATELNGRFTALQLSNEEIKNQMLASVALCYQLVSISTDGNAILGNILTQHVLTNSYLEDMYEVQKKIYSFMNSTLKTNLESIKKGVE